MQGFIDFIKEKGVVGLAIGFLIGGAIGTAELKWGHFISSMVDFVIIAAIVYFGFRLLRLDRLDKKPEPAKV